MAVMRPPLSSATTGAVVVDVICHQAEAVKKGGDAVRAVEGAGEEHKNVTSGFRGLDSNGRA
eukprot:5877318-Pleurochrysis_carterae.AAC.2